MFQALLELSLLTIVLLFMVTQVLIPIKRGEPLFPIFLKERKELSKEVEAANEEVVQERLRTDVQTAKSQAETLRTRRASRTTKAVKPQEGKGEQA